MLRLVFGSDITEIICSYTYDPRDAYDLAMRADLEGLTFLITYRPRVEAVDIDASRQCRVIIGGERCASDIDVPLVGCCNDHADLLFERNAHSNKEHIFCDAASGAIWKNKPSVLRHLYRMMPDTMVLLFPCIRAQMQHPANVAPCDADWNIRYFSEIQPLAEVRAECRARGISTFRKSREQLAYELVGINPTQLAPRRAMLQWLDERVGPAYRSTYEPRYRQILDAGLAKLEPVHAISFSCFLQEELTKGTTSREYLDAAFRRLYQTEGPRDMLYAITSTTGFIAFV